VQGQQAVRLTSSDPDDALTDAEDIRRYLFVTPLFRFAAFVILTVDNRPEHPRNFKEFRVFRTAIHK
jgi:hypothetical protein